MIAGSTTDTNTTYFASRSGLRSDEGINCRNISITLKRTVEICAAHPSLKESEGWGTLDLGKNESDRQGCATRRLGDRVSWKALDMGICISLQKENGVQIEGVADHTNVLHRILPQGKDNILSGIDWYGDTVFNGQQMERFLAAWRELKAGTENPEEAVLLSAVEGFSERCAAGTHLYLKFVGD